MKKTLQFLLFFGSLATVQGQSVPCYFDSLRLLDTIASKNAYNIQQTIRSSFLPSIHYRKVFSPKRSLVPQAKYIIPIVVHVVYSSTDSLTNISDAQINHQIDLLNESMKDSANGIQFCFAKKDESGGTITVAKLIYSVEVKPNPDGKYKYVISLSDQSSGIYTVQVISDGLNHTSKVVLIK